MLRNGVILIGIIFSLSFGVFGREARAEASHLVISEVQITGGKDKSNNDFVEIYNPTNTAVDISSWQLKKRIKSGTESSIRVFGRSKTILAHGYFLWANTTDNFNQTIGADESSGAILTNDCTHLTDFFDMVVYK